MAVIGFINQYIIGPALPVMIFASGTYMFFSLRGFIVLHPIKILSVFFKRGDRPGSFSPFKAVSLALAGTLGVGNIIGVASAIAAGGPGAVFWMLISSFAAMIIKYSEIVLAMLYRRPADNGEHFHGGAMYYIKSKKASLFFAAAIIFASFTLGNLIQVKAASDALNYALDTPPPLTGLVFSVFTLAVIAGGIGKISDITIKLIPFLTVVYIIISLYIIIGNASGLPSVIKLIITDAFRPAAAVGGIGGFFLSSAMRYGVSRGILSNEAGCGTAPIAHAEANIKSPAEQGCWGIFEVFADTVLLCSLTAFVILLAFDGSGLYCYENNGMILAAHAFEYFLGPPAAFIIGFSICLFAYATVICWAHYGFEGLYYITKKRVYRNIYIFLYGISAFVGAMTSFESAWQAADLAVGVMTLLNTFYIIMLSKETAKETVLYFSFKCARQEKKQVPREAPASPNIFPDRPLRQVGRDLLSKRLP